MRQAGVIAAACEVALPAGSVSSRITSSPGNWGGSCTFPGSVDLDQIETNMVRVDVEALGMGWPEVKAASAPPA